KGGNFDAEAAGGLNDQRSRGNLDVAVVNFQLYKFRFSHGFLSRAEQDFRGFVVGAASLQMVRKLVAEFLHDADGGHRRGITERTEGAAQHVIRKVADQVDILSAAQAGVKSLQHFVEPACSFAARDAPAAGFVRVEVHDAARHIHHAGVFVDDHHAAGPEHGAGLGDGVVIHGNVDFVSLEDRTGTAAGDDRLEFLAAANATGDLVDELLHVHTKRDFVDAGLVDMARDAEETRAAISWCAAAGVGFAAFKDNGGDRAQCFHVVDDRRTAVQADDSGEGRLDARVAALAFERFHQRGFLAALVSARTGMNQQIEVEAGAEDVFAEITAFVGFGDGRIHDVQHVAVFTANIDKAVMRIDGTARDDDAFNQLVRVHFHQRAVLAGAGLGFIGVADDVPGLWQVLGDEGPLEAGGETRSAAAAEVGLFDLIDDLRGLHLLERFVERLISAVLQGHVNLVGVLDAPLFANKRGFGFRAFVQCAGDDALGLGLL